MAYIGKQPAAAALTSADIEDGVISTADIADGAITAAKINGLTASIAELNYVDGVTSAVQTQLDAKIPTSAIGSTVQAYDADTAKYDDTTANFVGTLQNGGSNVVVDSDIGVTVQAYNANILTSSDIGSTVQAYNANILTSSDIGSTIQAYDADLDTWSGKTAPTGTVVGTSDSQTLTNKTFTGYTETVYTLGTSGSIALDPANGTIQTSTLSGDPTFTDSLSAGQSLVLMLNGGASYTVTWPTMTWVGSGGNVAPTLTANDVVVLWKVSTTLYGAWVGSAA